MNPFSKKGHFQIPIINTSPKQKKGRECCSNLPWCCKGRIAVIYGLSIMNYEVEPHTPHYRYRPRPLPLAEHYLKGEPLSKDRFSIISSSKTTSPNHQCTSPKHTGMRVLLQPSLLFATCLQRTPGHWEPCSMHANYSWFVRATEPETRLTLQNSNVSKQILFDKTSLDHISRQKIVWQDDLLATFSDKNVC